MTLFVKVNTNVKLAKPLSREVDARNDSNPQVFASLGYSF